MHELLNKVPLTKKSHAFSFVLPPKNTSSVVLHGTKEVRLVLKILSFEDPLNTSHWSRIYPSWSYIKEQISKIGYTSASVLIAKIIIIKRKSNKEHKKYIERYRNLSLERQEWSAIHITQNSTISKAEKVSFNIEQSPTIGVSDGEASSRER